MHHHFYWLNWEWNNQRKATYNSTQAVEKGQVQAQGQAAAEQPRQQKHRNQYTPRSWILLVVEAVARFSKVRISAVADVKCVLPRHVSNSHPHTVSSWGGWTSVRIASSALFFKHIHLGTLSPCIGISNISTVNKPTKILLRKWPCLNTIQFYKS